MSPHPLSGSQSLALGAIQAGVRLVTGYPGSPTTAVVDHILRATRPEDVRVEWTSNEKVAAEMAFGASLAGARSLLCVKSVGLNIALDPLMVYNLAGCEAGFVVLLGDDPEGWGSQNEQDTRILALQAELPLLEPTSVADAQVAMLEAFRLSEAMRLPVIVRVTRALVEAKEGIPPAGLGPTEPPASAAAGSTRPLSIVLPIDVVVLHQRLLEKLETVRAGFERSPLNGVEGEGSRGIVAAGYTYQKLLGALGGGIPPGLRVLRLGTPHPLPEETITGFLRALDKVLVLEETAPLVEQAVRATAQRAGLCLPVYGRATGHVPGAGELRASHLVQAVRALRPDLPLVVPSDETKPMPSRVPLCEACPYIPTFTELTGLMAELGGRDRYIVVGDPGCMVRSQLLPIELLDVKHALGSSIGLATGLAVAQGLPARRVVALAGDSGFLHTGLNALMDAARAGVPLLLIILDNGTTALSGGQPHPGTPVDARGRLRPAVDLAALARAAGAQTARTVDVNDRAELRAALRRGLEAEGVTVVVARGPCPERRGRE